MLTHILKGKPMAPKEPGKPVEEQKPQPDATGSDAAKDRPREIGGPKGPEPTRYQDWERGGRCIDF